MTITQFAIPNIQNWVLDEEYGRMDEWMDG